MDSLTSRFSKEVFIPYLDLLKAEYRIHSVFEHARGMWEEKLTANELVNGPYLERSSEGDLAAVTCGNIRPTRFGSYCVRRML